MNIEITVDTSRFDRRMADFPAKIASAQKRALMAIGQAVASRATLAFRSSVYRPSPWAPRKKPGDGHPLLIKSGHLRQSISWKLDGDDAVVVGTSQEYAKYHQHGTKKMPARPFLPVDKSGQLTPDCMREIKEAVEEAFAIELRKIGLQ